MSPVKTAAQMIRDPIMILSSAVFTLRFTAVDGAVDRLSWAVSAAAGIDSR
jgi:hypothetical protein